MEEREVTQRTQKRKDIRSMDYEQLQQEMVCAWREAVSRKAAVSVDA